jgi:hypothetical protein
MGHNVWMHLESVQRANREFDAGRYPRMMRDSKGGHDHFADIVEAIFATSDRTESETIIDNYSRYWMDIIGTRGFKGKKTVNANTMFNQLFDVAEVDTDPEDQLNLQALQQLEQDQV